MAFFVVTGGQIKVVTDQSLAESDMNLKLAPPEDVPPQSRHDYDGHAINHRSRGRGLLT